MSKNKKNNQRRPAAAKAASVSAPAQKKKRFSPVRYFKSLSVRTRRILCISLAAVLLFGGAVSGHFIYVANAGYNYMEEDLSRYVTFSKEKFKEIKLAVSVDKPTEADLEWELVQLQVEYTEDTDLVIGGDPLNDVISAGSKVSLYYVGYTVLENGMREYFSGGSNLADAAPGSVTVGGKTMIADLEKGLIGLRPTDTAMPTLITSGKINEGDTVCVDIVGSHPDGTSINTYAHPLVVTPALDDIYGEGFYELLLGSTIGKRAFTGIKLLSSKEQDGETFVYTSVRPQYKIEGGKAATIEVRFPVDYEKNSPLNGKEAFFEVYIKGTTSYNVPEMTDAFLTDTVKIVPSRYDDYEGETLVQRYKNAIWEDMLAEYEQKLLDAAETDFWREIMKAASVSRVPLAAINMEYDFYMENLKSEYEDYITAMEIDSKDYPFKTFAKDYLQENLSDGDSYKSYARKVAMLTASEKMVFFYAIKAMGVAPSAEELKAALDESIYSLAEQNCGLDESYYQNKSYTVEQRKQAYEEYLDMIEKTKTEILEHLGEEYFLESAYYNYGFPKLLNQVKITYVGKGHE